jgi:hypothetical protein
MNESVLCARARLLIAEQEGYQGHPNSAFHKVEELRFAYFLCALR